MYRFRNILESPYWVTTLSIGIIGWIIAFIGSVFNNVYYNHLFQKFCWWVLTFQLLSILLTIHVALSHEEDKYYRLLLGLISISFVYTTNSANVFVWGNNWSSGMVAAGYILLSIVNLLWLFQLSTTDENKLHSKISALSMNKEDMNKENKEDLSKEDMSKEDSNKERLSG